MRYEHDHPRTWPELLVILLPDEAEAFRVFLVARGVLPDLSDADTVESWYSIWCVAAAPVPPVRVQ